MSIDGVSEAETTTMSGEEELRQKIKEVKLMAISLKQKLFNENKGDIDKLIIDYAQLQKNYFQQKNELQKLQNQEQQEQMTAIPNSSQQSGSLQDRIKGNNKGTQTESESAQNNTNQLVKEKKQYHQYAKLKIDSGGVEGLITIQPNRIVIYQAQSSTTAVSSISLLNDEQQHKSSSTDEQFKASLQQSCSSKELVAIQLSELQSVEYQKLTVKLNLDKLQSLKIQFSNQDSLRAFDSLLYLSKIRTIISDRRPYFHHPELPKIPGLSGKVIKANTQQQTSQLQQSFQQQQQSSSSKSTSPFRSSLLPYDLNSTIASVQQTGTNNGKTSKRQSTLIIGNTPTPVFPSRKMNESQQLQQPTYQQSEDAMKFFSSSLNLGQANKTQSASPMHTDNITLFKERAYQSQQQQQQQQMLGFKQRRSLIVEKGKEFFSFLKSNPQKIQSTEEFDDTISHPNDISHQVIKETSYFDSSNKLTFPQQNNLNSNNNQITQYNTNNGNNNNNDSILNDSILSRSMHSIQHKQSIKTTQLTFSIPKEQTYNNTSNISQPQTPYQQQFQQQSQSQGSVLNQQNTSFIQIKSRIKTDEEIHEESLLQLKKGVAMMKYSKGGYKPHEKLVVLDVLGQNLTWFQPGKKEKKPKSIALKDVIQIRLGRNSPGFEKFKKLEKHISAERSFFIVCGSGRRLELEAVDSATRNAFIKNLECHLQMEFKNTYTQKPLPIEGPQGSSNFNQNEINSDEEDDSD